MEWKNTDLKTRLNIIGIFILLAAVSSSALIYLTALSDSGGEPADGFVYHARPEDSKTYIHDLKLYGGKANVFADRFVRWFEGLWHGKSLASTVACIGVAISSLLLIIAKRIPSGLQSAGHNKNKKD